ncbi:MAG: carbohydrate ABC transporter permease [Treponema sp.]|jgi:multiple sugar transport system permease protein/putative aldouronate transport system permease protein|nr:carbohydrate ABC transporter permease [Treponema sp.]
MANNKLRFRPLKVKTSPEDLLLYSITNAALVILLVIIVYPLIYMVSSSFSSGRAVSSGRVFLLPVEPTLDGYRTVFSYKSVMLGYRNTILYTVVGTSVNVMMTLIAAFPLSRKNFQGRKFYMTLFIITMFFSGGLIPSYILITQLKLINSIWAIILPGAISTYNMIITRTFFASTIPQELVEASQIDGCDDFRFFFTILLPLSKAVVAVIGLYYGVSHWNAWFSAMLYLRDPVLQPLQLVLRSILIAVSIDVSQIQDPELLERMVYMADLMKYALIIVATVPIAALYPFVQRYFIKGVMIGSVKG